MGTVVVVHEAAGQKLVVGEIGSTTNLSASTEADAEIGFYSILLKNECKVKLKREDFKACEVIKKKTGKF